MFLRVSGKRTLAKLNSFDFVVTVAIGSTLASVLTSKSLPLADGALALALLVALQFAVAWLTVRVRWFERLVKSRPVAVFRRREFDEAVMLRERLARDEVLMAVRRSGFHDLDRVFMTALHPWGHGRRSVSGPKSADVESVSPCRPCLSHRVRAFLTSRDQNVIDAIAVHVDHLKAVDAGIKRVTTTRETFDLFDHKPSERVVVARVDHRQVERLREVIKVDHCIHEHRAVPTCDDGVGVARADDTLGQVRDRHDSCNATVLIGHECEMLPLGAEALEHRKRRRVLGDDERRPDQTPQVDRSAGKTLRGDGAQL